MSTEDHSKQLYSTVEKILDDEEFEVFGSYWNVAQELLKDSLVRGYYIYLASEYFNVAVLTDRWLVDVAGDEGEDEGSLNVTQLRALGQIEFHEDPVPSIPDSKDAELVMIVFQLGAPNEYRYWVADDEREREQLIRFGRAVVRAVDRLT